MIFLKHLVKEFLIYTFGTKFVKDFLFYCHYLFSSFRTTFLHPLFFRIGNLVPYVPFGGHVFLVFDYFFGSKGSDFGRIEQKLAPDSTFS